MGIFSNLQDPLQHPEKGKALQALFVVGLLVL